MREEKSFLDKISPFSLVLTMVVMMVVGLGLTPLIDVASKPRPQQGKKLTVNYWWRGASPNVVEHEITSRIEGLVSMVKGVERVKSLSGHGYGKVEMVLKKEANVSAVKFEISSLLKQVSKSLPEGVHPYLEGGSTGMSEARKPKEETLLNYRINADLDGEQIKEYIEANVKPVLSGIEGVTSIDVTGGVSKYIEIAYDPFVLSNYDIYASEIEDAIKRFIGKRNIVGDIQTWDDAGEKQRITLHLETARFANELGDIPIKKVGDKIIYLNNLATYAYKEVVPDYYYRVNGLSSINMNIKVDVDANQVKLSKELQDAIAALQPRLSEGFYLTLVEDHSVELQSELEKLIQRTLLSLIILLVFVWLVSRSLKYLTIILITLIANILIAVIVYYIADIRLHIFSLAGVAVSFGILIDSSIVMVDHYSYYKNRKAFLAILAALVTTIGSLIVIFFMPEYIQRDLHDFSLVIIINLTVALIVALLFVPAVIQQMNFSSRQQMKPVRSAKMVIRWSHFYEKYICFTQKRKWIYMTIMILAFGIPFFALPTKLGMGSYGQLKRELKWYEQVYNETLGSRFYQNTLKEPFDKFLGGTMRLFAQSLGSNTYARQKPEMTLSISGKMPLGGKAYQLNEKVLILEKLLVTFDEIKRFETTISPYGATIKVEFKDEHRETGFPYYLESEVIGKVIDIGGADWSTWGVSERGFSNSLNLGRRQHTFRLSGYNYNRLYEIAEEVTERITQNKRVTDVRINTPGHYGEQEEMFMQFNRDKIAQYDINIGNSYRMLRELFVENHLGYFHGELLSSNIRLKSVQHDQFDLWNLMNTNVKVGEDQVNYAEFASISKRQSKNVIPKENQEYTLDVEYNFIGSYSLASKFKTETTEYLNSVFPVGYRVADRTWGGYHDDGTQYWLILLIVVIIFFMCSILFESWRLPMIIISLIPMSFIGTFLTFYFTGVNFGTGGFASLVLLSGLVVNAAIYIVNEYENTTESFQDKGLHRNRINLYVRAFNHKIIPVFLTILSTVLGLIPFLLDGQKEAFWFPFAVGTSGGLLFSIVALVFMMPIFMSFKEKK